jgi:uncharacterized DUF497 family protein
MAEVTFDWDQWNVQKNELKHGASQLEVESVFYDPRHRLFEDEKHSTLASHATSCTVVVSRVGS